MPTARLPIDAAHRAASSDAHAIGAVTGLTSALGDANLRVVAGCRNTESPRPLVTFIDDDGHDAVLSVLKPLFIGKGVPCGLAIPGNAALVTDAAKRAEVKALQDDHGWEVLSHTMAHTNLTTMTDDEIEADCKTFLETFAGYGLHVHSIVYPWGAIQAAQYPIVSKYYVAGFNTGTSSNTADLKDYAIYRRALGTMMEESLNSLSEFQALVDDAYTNGKWVVFMLHCGTDDFDAELVGQVIDYVQSKGIDIVSPFDGLRVFGTVSGSGLGATRYFNIKPNGYVSTNSYALPEVISARLETDAPASLYISQRVFPAIGWTLGSGIVEEWTHANGWQYQLFYKSGSDALVYIRKWDGAAWKPWQRFTTARTDITYTMTARTLTAGSVVDVTVYDTSIIATHAHVAQPTGALEAGVMWTCWSYGNGAVKIRLHNTTGSDVVLAERIWRVKRID